MSGLNDDDLEIIKDILGPDEDSDPIFGNRKDDSPIPPIIPNSSSNKNPNFYSNYNKQGGAISPKSYNTNSGPNSPRTTTKATNNANIKETYGPMKKCTSICLGGPDLPAGMNTETSGPRFCSSLSCLSCDFNVRRFKDCRWKTSTDYLFLRNNFPDSVQQNLVHAAGWCAYCCQCTFCEEQNTRKLPAYSSNWVCRGHRC